MKCPDACTVINVHNLHFSKSLYTETAYLHLVAQCAVLVGGVDMMAQSIVLAKRPHVIVGTPGRVVDHLTNTKVRKLALEVVS